MNWSVAAALVEIVRRFEVRRLGQVAASGAASILMCLPLQARALEIVFPDSGGKYSDLLGPMIPTLRGEIVPGDYEKVKRLLRGTDLEVAGTRSRSPAGLLSINLDSPGGDVREAIRIAELVRDAHVPVTVGKRCASACFFIFAAAVERSARPGQVGLHRPAMAANDYQRLTGEQTRLATRRFTDEVRRFLEDHDVPRNLADKMVEVPSDQIYWLSAEDLARLGRYAPHFQEAVIAECGSETSRRVDSKKWGDWQACAQKVRHRETDRWDRKTFGPPGKQK